MRRESRIALLAISVVNLTATAANVYFIWTLPPAIPCSQGMTLEAGQRCYVTIEMPQPAPGQSRPSRVDDF
jgi:hypothetical protein